MKRRLGPSDTLFPVPAALVVSGSLENPNVLAVAWIGIVSSSPPALAMSLRSGRHSLQLIRETRDFTVNIPSAEYFKEVDYCGLTSGRKHDKFKDMHFTAVPSHIVGPPLITECPYNIECKVIGETLLGDWVVIFGEIVETHIDEDKIDESTGMIDVSKVNPLVYCATIREYWDLGKRLGKGFHAGHELMDGQR